MTDILSPLGGLVGGGAIGILIQQIFALIRRRGDRHVEDLRHQRDDITAAERDFRCSLRKELDQVREENRQLAAELAQQRQGRLTDQQRIQELETQLGER